MKTSAQYLLIDVLRCLGKSTLSLQVDAGQGDSLAVRIENYGTLCGHGAATMSKLGEKERKELRRTAFELHLQDDQLIAVGHVAIRSAMLDKLIDLTGNAE